VKLELVVSELGVGFGEPEKKSKKYFVKLLNKKLQKGIHPIAYHQTIVSST
jgi:hypothetical protein